MKCEECLAVIEEVFDGELDDRAAAPVAAHLAGCRGCAAVWQSLGREAELYARYQRDVFVTPALWEGVQSRIQSRAAARPANLVERLRQWLAGAALTPRFSFGLAAALVVVTVLATVAVMRALNDSPAPQVARHEPQTPRTDRPAEAPNAVQEPPATASETAQEPRPAANPPAPAPNLTAGAKRPARKAPLSPEQLVREAEAKYLEAISLLARDVERRKSQLSPDVVARFEASLAQINSTIAETRRAVRENPSDPIAMQYMIAAYSKKVELLREMSTDDR